MQSFYVLFDTVTEGTSLARAGENEDDETERMNHGDYAGRSKDSLECTVVENLDRLIEVLEMLMR